MAVSAGTAVLQVAPQLVKTFSRDVANQMVGPATKAATKTGQESGRRFGQEFGGQMAMPLGQAADRTGKDTGKRLGGKIGGGLKAATLPMIAPFRLLGPAMLAAFGGAALVAGIRSVTDEAREAAIVGNQTAAVLKSTGGAANISAKGVEALATALSNKAGVDDEVIQTSQNLLLTFTGIRNEVGKGNDIFNQASTSIVDMTAAMNGGKVTASGLKSATIQVGKALNDPIKGMTALSRVGVTFTQGQKDQVKALVESGDKLGAQKIILAELRKEFGGSAAASADAGKRFGVFVGNLKEQIGKVLLPIMNRFLGFLVDNLPKALAVAGQWFGTIRQAIAGVVGWFQRAAAAAGKMLGPALRSIGEAVAPAAAAFTRSLLPGLKTLWKVIQAQVLPALKVVAAIIGVTLYAALKYVLPIILRLAGPVLGFLFKQISQTIQWVSNVIRWIGRLGAWFLRWITGTKTTGDAVRVLGQRVAAFVDSMKRQWASVVSSITGALGRMRSVTVTVLSAIIRFWLRWAGNIIDAAATALGWMPGLGPKLRTAAAKFHAFAASTNAALNKIQDEDVNIKIKGTFQPPKGFSMHSIVGRARGGPINIGTSPTADDVPAMLSKGEYVINARATKKHRPLIEAINRDGLTGFARGGGVDVDVLAPQMGRFGSRISSMIDAASKRLGARLERRLRIFVEGGVGKAGILSFIRSVDRLPYVWGAAGPGAYDCSGLVGAVHGKMRGLRGAGRGLRLYTTASIRPGIHGLKSGLGGTLQIGVTAGSGHMAGRYGGLGFEAASSRTGIKVGATARRPESFARKYHLAKGGEVLARKVDELTRAGILDVGGDAGKLRINGQTFDRGGTLAPGLNLLANKTGRPEPLVPAGRGLSRADAKMIAEELAKVIPSSIRVDDIHTGLLRKKNGRNGGVKLGLT